MASGGDFVSVHGATLVALALSVEPHLLGNRGLPRRELLLHDVAVPAAPRVPVGAILVAHLHAATRARVRTPEPAPLCLGASATFQPGR